MIETVIRNDIQTLLDLTSTKSSAPCASVLRLAGIGLVVKRGRTYRLSEDGKRFIEAAANQLHMLYRVQSGAK